MYAICLLGSIYLIYMGVRMVWAQLWGQSRAVVGVAVTCMPYMKGLISSITNTKTLVLFVSFLPQFMDI
jgi:threonine/homoserine/homoserine lactone efflux protein